MNIRNQQTKLESYLKHAHIQPILDQCSISILPQIFTLSGLIFAGIIFCGFPGFWSFLRNIIHAKSHKISAKFKISRNLIGAKCQEKCLLVKSGWQKVEKNEISDFPRIFFSKIVKR